MEEHETNKNLIEENKANGLNVTIIHYGIKMKIINKLSCM